MLITLVILKSYDPRGQIMTPHYLLRAMTCLEFTGKTGGDDASCRPCDWGVSLGRRCGLRIVDLGTLQYLCHSERFILAEWPAQMNPDNVADVTLVALVVRHELSRRLERQVLVLSLLPHDTCHSH